MFIKSHAALPSPPHPLRPPSGPSQALLDPCSMQLGSCLSSRISVAVAGSGYEVFGVHAVEMNILPLRCWRLTPPGLLSDPSQPQLPHFSSGQVGVLFPGSTPSPLAAVKTETASLMLKPDPLRPGCPDCAVQLHPHHQSPPHLSPAPRQTPPLHGPSVPLRHSPCRHQCLFLGACTNHCLFKIFLCLRAWEILGGASYFHSLGQKKKKVWELAQFLFKPVARAGRFRCPYVVKTVFGPAHIFLSRVMVICPGPCLIKLRMLYASENKPNKIIKNINN